MQGGGGELLLLGLLVGLLTGELVLCSQQGCILYKGIKGENITLSPKVNVDLSEIIWKRNETNKVAEWDGKLHLYTQLENRAEIDPSSGNLTIWNISQDKDGGKYIAEPLIDGEFKPTDVCLDVLEPPAAPNLTCIIGDDGIHVNCMTQYELPVIFHWKYIDMKDISKGNDTKEHSSIKLPSNTDQSRNVTCIIEASRSMVKNSISLLTCVSRGASSQERTRDITVGLLIVGAIVGLILGVCFLWRKNVQAQTKPTYTEDPENEIGQGREENPLNDGSMSSHGQMFELENKKTPCSEEDPEKHVDGSEPTYRLMSEAENKKTSSREDLSDKPPNECTPLCAANSEATKASNSEDLSDKPPNEYTPLCAVNSEATKASNSEDLSDKPSDECIPISNFEATAN